jgi:hypothetical protein
MKMMRLHVNHIQPPQGPDLTWMITLEDDDETVPAAFDSHVGTSALDDREDDKVNDNEAHN